VVRDDVGERVPVGEVGAARRGVDVDHRWLPHHGLRSRCSAPQRSWADDSLDPNDRASAEGDVMGQVVGAGLVAHVPTMVMAEDTRRELNEGNAISLVTGMHDLRTQVLDPLGRDPGIDTVIVFDSHWFTTFEFVVTAHARRTGKYTSDELP